MSLLHLETEPADEQFLAEIISFLDVDWPSSSTASEPLTGGSSKSTSTQKLRRLRPRATSGDAVVKPKRVRKETTPRVRNKAKIELLRHEIKGLEAVLASLQNSRRGEAILEHRRAGSLWKIIAMKQSHERQLAENRNMGLKRMLAQQYTLTRSLTHVLDEWTDLPAPDLRLSACI
ncbi:hypothetical protein P3T76_010413 [Phytophthora citrophthora]|uniref:Uncharacterized protein n=1 Tax=Phytophthora citrophthora TaxID=4793 RepID=A0AAD9GBX6_9STRA|nr:hypothetical protein P3T76_010413 [Phytophthora citrophthora]